MRCGNSGRSLPCSAVPVFRDDPAKPHSVIGEKIICDAGTRTGTFTYWFLGIRTSGNRQWKLGIWPQLRLVPRLAVTYRRHTPRLVQAINALESDHPNEQHYYLPFVGVVPEWRGRGLGAALLRPVLERCDRERMPAYLEASAPRNRRLYERLGFVVTEEFRLGKGSPPLWRMWREPQ